MATPPSSGKDPSTSKESSSGCENKPSNDSNNEQKTTGAKCANSIIVSPRQKGNPLLKNIRNIPWEHDDIVPDYLMGKTACALFLSLRYHNLHPNYIHTRLKDVGSMFSLRVLLVLVDSKDPQHALGELAKMCLLAGWTLLPAWSNEEAARYLETYKSYEHKPPDSIMERAEKNCHAQMVDCLTSIKSVNKTDALTLLSTFGSFDKISKASIDDLSICPGFGPQKKKKVFDVFRTPFRKTAQGTASGLGSSPVKGNQAAGTADTAADSPAELPPKRAKTDTESVI